MAPAADTPPATAPTISTMFQVGKIAISPPGFFFTGGESAKPFTFTSGTPFRLGGLGFYTADGTTNFSGKTSSKLTVTIGEETYTGTLPCDYTYTYANGTATLKIAAASGSVALPNGGTLQFTRDSISASAVSQNGVSTMAYGCNGGNCTVLYTAGAR